jgi:hypothetical protein
LLVPFSPNDPRPATHTFDGFTEELAVKLAVDVNPHVSANVKLCWGCHGFELPMGFVDFRLADEFNVRVGRFTPTFGEFFLRSDVGNHRTSDKPLPYDMGRMLYLLEWNRSVLPMPYVENGVEISGSHFFGNAVQVDYAAHVVTGLRANAAAPYDVEFQALRQPAPYYIDNNSMPSVGGRLGTTFRLSERADFTVGASVMYGPYDPAGQLTYLIVGGDAFLRIGRTNIRSEYILRRTEMAAGDQSRFEGVVPIEPNGGGLVSTLPMVKDGWYVELEQPVNRYVDLVLRWDGLHRRGNVQPGSPLDFEAGISRWTAGANFVVYRGFRVKASVEHYYFWGLRNELPQAVGFHLSAVATF